MSLFFNKTILFVALGVSFVVAAFLSVSHLLSDEYMYAKFRTMQDKIISSEGVNLKGLDKLLASGSSIMDFSLLKDNLSSIKKPFIIVDTARIRHGYINGIPTIYFAYSSQKGSELRFLLRRLIFTGTFQQQLDLVVNEKEMAQKYGYGYVHLRIDSKRETPDDAVAEFVACFDKAPENVWFHFHCHHGKGRTTLSLVMLDIMRNAPDVSLEDIVKRHSFLHTVDLFDTTVWSKNSTYTSKSLERRKKLIQDFYAFICQRKAGGIQLWSEWKRERKKV